MPVGEIRRGEDAHLKLCACSGLKSSDEVGSSVWQKGVSDGERCFGLVPRQ